MDPAKISRGHCPRCGGELEFKHTVEATEPEHSYTFSGAKTAATFIQLNADLLRCVGKA